MPPLTEAITRVEEADANVRGMFGSDLGRRIVTPVDDPAREAAIVEAVTFYQDCVSGRRPEHHLREALSTSDFPLLFGDVMNRTLLAGYREQTYTWSNYASRRTVADLREAKMLMVDGGAGRLERVKERTEYPESTITESQDTVRPFKYGRSFDVDLEMLINDDLGVFGTDGVLTRFGRGSRRTEEWVATNLFVGTAGPASGIYTAGNGNIVTGNPTLSRASLQAALTQLAQQTDSDGEPISIEAVELVVPTALALTAQEIIGATQYRSVDADGNVTIITGNGVSANLRISVNHYISQVADTNADTSWFLFANPTVQRPALVMAFLRGYESPQMFEKAPDAQRLGGGGTDIVDFEIDARRYKVRHFVGGVAIDPKATIASNGSGA